MERISFKNYVFNTFFYFTLSTVVFFLVQILHFKASTCSIVLHCLIVDIFISIVAVAIVTRLVYKHFRFVYWFNSTLIFLLFSSLYTVLGPTMCDRSLSVFVLLAARDAVVQGSPLTKIQMVELVNSKYIRGDHMVTKRLVDQEKSGALDISDGQIKITKKGKAIASIFDFFYNWLGIQKTF